MSASAVSGQTRSVGVTAVRAIRRASDVFEQQVGAERFIPARGAARSPSLADFLTSQTDITRPLAIADALAAISQTLPLLAEARSALHDAQVLPEAVQWLDTAVSQLRVIQNQASEGHRVTIGDFGFVNMDEQTPRFLIEQARGRVASMNLGQG